mgnify:CR=1 FL=1
MVENKQQWKAWLYLSPAILLLLVFTVWPIFNTLRMAFLNGYGNMAAMGGATIASAEEAYTYADTIKWDAQYDVVVLGMGFAGMNAAIAAVDAGASVVICDINESVNEHFCMNAQILQI